MIFYVVCKYHNEMETEFLKEMTTFSLVSCQFSIYWTAVGLIIFLCNFSFYIIANPFRLSDNCFYFQNWLLKSNKTVVTFSSWSLSSLWPCLLEKTSASPHAQTQKTMVNGREGGGKHKSVRDHVINRTIQRLLIYANISFIWDLRVSIRKYGRETQKQNKTCNK